MRILVTGGAGFIGSHLCDYLLDQGHTVVCLDSFFSGKKENIAHHLKNSRFELIKHDVRKPLTEISGPLDRIYHLACPASPVQYQFDPVLTLETSVKGMQNVLDLARRTGARVLFTSTSEVYGDPLEHPQKETYWGNVDPLGKRACYDEGKRAAETLCKDYRSMYHVDARIVRIFNTYGPRMMFNDGRVLSNFILQALLGDDITVHGDGKQTRSFMYVADILPALVVRMEVAGDWEPVNLGNPDERSVVDLAQSVKDKTGTKSQIVFVPLAEVPGRIGDPQRRCPDIYRAKQLLGWEPKISFAEGLEKTIADFRGRLATRPRVLVFSTNYQPFMGPAEEAVQEITKRLVGYEFDIVTAKFDSSLPSESHEERVHIYRLGLGTKWDKFFFPLRAALFAKRLHRQHNYGIVWAIMASYAGLAASIFSSMFGARLPFLLSVYEGNIDETMLRRGKWLSPIYAFIFRRAHRWQVVGDMTEPQRAWLENERQVQTIVFDKEWDLLAKRTKEVFQEVEILSTRLSV